MRTRAVTAAAIGTALEWFDFTLYGALAATILPKLFFPAMDPTSALLASLATFGVGLAARPLGAIICGHLGDKLGRRNLMLGTVTVMGLASMLMGLLPTYASIGVWAPVLLVLLRILQGFALGGESTGAQLMAIEHASPDRRGKYSGLLGLCSPLSQIMANGVLLLLSSTMSADGIRFLRLAHPVSAELRADRGRRVYPPEGQRDARVRRAAQDGGRASRAARCATRCACTGAPCCAGCCSSAGRLRSSI